MAKNNSSNVFAVVETVFIIVCALAIALMLTLYFVFKKDNAVPKIGGYSFYYTRSVNMEPKIPKGSAIIAQESKVSEIIAGKSMVLANIGDNVTLIGVKEITEEDGVKYYTLKFETSTDNQTFRVPESEIIAKAIWSNGILGGLLTFATSTLGIMLVIIIPSFLIIVFQIIRIINVKRLEEEASSLDDIEEIFESRKPEEMSKMTISKPRFKEEITGEIKKLNVNSYGKAEYEKEDLPAKTVFESAGIAEPKIASENVREVRYERNKLENPLYTPASHKDELSSAADRANIAENFFKKPVTVGSRVGGIADFDDSLMRRPTKIEPVAPERTVSTADVVFDAAVDRARQSVLDSRQVDTGENHYARNGFDAITNDNNSTGFDASVRTFFTKSENSESANEIAPKSRTVAEEERPLTIPTDAVRPTGSLAPPVKRNNNRKVQDLMAFIDSAESQLKKK